MQKSRAKTKFFLLKIKVKNHLILKDFTMDPIPYSMHMQRVTANLCNFFKDQSLTSSSYFACSEEKMEIKRGGFL